MGGSACLLATSQSVLHSLPSVRAAAVFGRLRAGINPPLLPPVNPPHSTHEPKVESDFPGRAARVLGGETQ